MSGITMVEMIIIHNHTNGIYYDKYIQSYLTIFPRKITEAMQIIILS